MRLEIDLRQGFMRRIAQQIVETLSAGRELEPVDAAIAPVIQHHDREFEAEHGFKFAIPFLICAVTLVLLQYAPLNKVALQQNFHWHRADRERIVARVQAGQLKPNVSYNENLIALGGNEPNVSAGGNDIVVDQAQEGTYVLFLTSRGLKHYFTGFLYVPPGGDPKSFFEFEDKPPSQLVRYDKDWYFVAN